MLIDLGENESMSVIGITLKMPKSNTNWSVGGAGLSSSLFCQALRREFFSCVFVS